MERCQRPTICARLERLFRLPGVVRVLPDLGSVATDLVHHVLLCDYQGGFGRSHRRHRAALRWRGTHSLSTPSGRIHSHSTIFS